MIAKDRDSKSETSVQQKAGAKVEQDVAFYLRREFAESGDVFIINDLRIQFKNETAQIDHLVIYNKGFIVIESKSIRGEVKINNQLEWSRTVRGKWTGMPSPIEQAKLQSKLLKALLNENSKSLLEKITFIQAYFGGRCWDQLCAASNDALIDRDSAPKSISKQLTKSESIASAVNKLIKQHRSGVILNANPNFNRDELYRIVHFLIDQHIPSATSSPKNDKAEVGGVGHTLFSTTTDIPKETTKPSVRHGFGCKQCQSIETEPRYGKYGYYVYCPECKVNTALRINCYSCDASGAKVRKRKNTYTISCKCGEDTQVLFQ
ncbi:nuclease-related domain-containing protein [Aliivibrio kagoshimensis]|uniref:nuclease-related domain-containing protein n=1 Tax=Aliivibrio kagoshimensis TaxID=2910230 RepID=UPI003D0DEF0E